MLFVVFAIRGSSSFVGAAATANSIQVVFRLKRGLTLAEAASAEVTYLPSEHLYRTFEQFKGRPIR